MMALTSLCSSKQTPGNSPPRNPLPHYCLFHPLPILHFLTHLQSQLLTLMWALPSYSSIPFISSSSSFLSLPSSSSLLPHPSNPPLPVSLLQPFFLQPHLFLQFLPLLDPLPPLLLQILPFLLYPLSSPALPLLQHLPLQALSPLSSPALFFSVSPSNLSPSSSTFSSSPSPSASTRPTTSRLPVANFDCYLFGLMNRIYV